MSIAYPRRDKVTLPSVESWGTNNNILRDPPKSLYTRKIDRISDTCKLNDMIDGAGDRINENVLVYSRGRNPMIGGVDYSNNGNAGTAGGITKMSNHAEPKLPYRILDNGAFRPPILTQYDLLPLSRLPHPTYSITSKPEFKATLKQIECPSSMKEASKISSQTCIRPTATFKMERPVVENFSFAVKKDNLHVLANTNFVGMNKDAVNNMNFNGKIHDRNKGNYTTNIRGLNNDYDNRKIDRGLKEIRHMTLTSNIVGDERDGVISHIDDLKKNIPNYTATSNIYENRTDVKITPQNEQKLKRTTPITEALSNIGANQGIDMISSRNYNLRPSLDVGGFTNSGTIATTDREEIYNGGIDYNRRKLNQQYSEEYFNRYSQPSPY